MRKRRWYFQETFLIALFGVVALVFGTVLASKNSEAPPPKRITAEVMEQVERPPLTITVIEPAATSEGGEAMGGSATYRSEAYGFELTYPSYLKVSDGYFEPYTPYVLWQNPREGNAIVNIIYIQEGSSALSEAELAKGEAVSVGGRRARRFSLDERASLYWVSADDYALAIYYERPPLAGSSYNDWIDISSIKF